MDPVLNVKLWQAGPRTCLQNYLSSSARIQDWCVQIAAKLEEEKARIEEEVLATARIATSLEARLRSAHAAQEAASAQAAAALRQAAEVQPSCMRGQICLLVVVLCRGDICTLCIAHGIISTGSSTFQLAVSIAIRAAATHSCTHCTEGD